MSYCRTPSYWSGGSKETKLGNLLLIIVNALTLWLPSSYIFLHFFKFPPNSMAGNAILWPTIRLVWGHVGATSRRLRLFPTPVENSGRLWP